MDTCGHLRTPMDTYALGLGGALSPLHAVAAWTPMDTYEHLWTPMDTYALGLYVALLPLHAVAA